MSDLADLRNNFKVKYDPNRQFEDIYTESHGKLSTRSSSEMDRDSLIEWIPW